MTSDIMAITGRLRGTLESLPKTLELTKAILKEGSRAVDNSISAFTKTENLITAVKKDLGEMSQDLVALENSRAFNNVFSLRRIDSDSVGSFIQSPVNMKTTTFYPVKNYGSAMTPFYTNLALWVGGIVLVSVVKLEVDTDRRLLRTAPSRTYMGRLLLLILLAAVQGLIATAGDIWLLGVQCNHHWLFMLAGVICSITFINIIFALSITFKHIGKALAVLFIILQIPGGSGTYPIEMTPMFFQRLHPFLPFTYGISAMREAIAGLYKGAFLEAVLKLMIFIPAFLFIGLGLRLLLLNLNNLFDKRLSETDLMISEKNTLVRRQPQLDVFMRALASDQDIRREVEKRRLAFERTYKQRIRRGIFLLCTLPLVFLCLMFFIRAKMTCLILWIISIIAIAVYLIVVEYINHRLTVESSVHDMSSDEIIVKIREEE